MYKPAENDPWGVPGTHRIAGLGIPNPFANMISPKEMMQQQSAPPPQNAPPAEEPSKTPLLLGLAVLAGALWYRFK